jgi:molybdate transport system substrate-binding protein
MKTISTIIFCSVILFACNQRDTQNESTITVFCAAGLVNVINELSDSFSFINDVEIKLNLASSGTLARQIMQGNNADIYISANKHWANYVDSIGKFNSQKSLYQNKLALIVPVNSEIDSINFYSTKSLSKLFSSYLSIGDPKHVPAGKYAEQALHLLGWDVDLKNRLLPAKDVRSAMMLVELEECEMGIVYYSDAIQSKKVRIVGIFPEDTHDPIIFYALLNKKTSDPAIRFFEYLSDTSLNKIWIKNGLRPLN